MTIGDLIDQLRKYDPNMQIYYDDSEYQTVLVTDLKIEEVNKKDAVILY